MRRKEVEDMEFEREISPIRGQLDRMETPKKGFTGKRSSSGQYYGA